MDAAEPACATAGRTVYFFYFYPLGLDRPLRCRPWLSWTLMAVMAVAFLWGQYLPWAFDLRPWNLVFYAGSAPGWTAVTAIFMHAGWLHLLGNLVYLHVFAPPLEERLGRPRFLLYFLIMGVGGNIAHGLVSAFGWLGQGGVGVLGASGAIAGLLGMSLVRLYDAKVQIGWWVLAPLAGQNRAGRTPVPMAAAVLLWVVLQVIQTLAATEAGTTTSFAAHFGGFATGLFLALALGYAGPARAEAAWYRAERYLLAGQFHAADGAWEEYLQHAPGDQEALLQRARVRQGLGRAMDAADLYRSVFASRVADGDASGALAVYDEARRGPGEALFEPGQLARVAYYFEKQGNHEAALDAYRSLFTNHPDHPDGHRALVRAIVLCRGKVADPAAARHFLEEARRCLPAGGWRDYLAEEFSGESDVGAEPAAAPAGPVR